MNIDKGRVAIVSAVAAIPTTLITFAITLITTRSTP